MGDHDVEVRFGKGIGPDEQGRALLALERFLRERGVPACVHKEAMPDDSRLRLRMTEERRKEL